MLEKAGGKQVGISWHHCDSQITMNALTYSEITESTLKILRVNWGFTQVQDLKVTLRENRE